LEVPRDEESLVGAASLILPTPSAGSARRNFVIGLICGFSVLAYGIVLRDETLVVLTLILMAVFAGIAAPITYGIGPQELTVRHGRWSLQRVPYDRIERLVPIHPNGDYSRPALVHMAYYDGKKLPLCAKDHERLLTEILSRSPQLQKFGHEWRRLYSADEWGNSTEG
jgi:hypothetical protein